MRIPFAVVLLILISFVFNVKSQNLSERLGVCTSPDKALLLKDAGYAYIEIGIRSFLMPDKPDSLFAFNLQQAEKSALPLYSGNGFFPGEMRLTGPDVNMKAILDYTKTAMQRAQKTGIKIFVLGSGGARRIHEGFSREEAKAQFVGLCKEIALLGEKYDVVVAIEPLRKEETNFINTVREGTEIAKEVNHPNLGVLADFYHMACENEEVAAIVEARDWLKHCHIAEKEIRSAPGVKGDDFIPYLSALKQINYKGAISMECRWDRFDSEVKAAIESLKLQIKQVYIK